MVLMRTWTLTLLRRRSVQAALVVFAVTAVVGIVVATAGERAEATHREHRLIVGLATSDAIVRITTSPPPWWHTEGQSLDLWANTVPTGNMNVYWQSWHQAGTTAMTVRVIDVPNSCTETRVEVKDASTGIVLGGNYFFKHLNAELAPNTTWTAAANNSWTIRWVGTVRTSTDTCAWSGIHLHQGGNVTGALLYNGPRPGGLYLEATNTTASAPIHWCDAPALKCRLTPTGDAGLKWMHKFQW